MKKLLFVIPLISITGCAQLSASGKPSQPVQHFSVAHPVVQPKRVERVPVPMPGQLMPVDHSNKTLTVKPLEKAQAVAAANQKAVQEPNSQRFINSMMTFDYMPGALYQVYSAPMKVTDLQFQPGESLISEAAGDTLRWQVSKTRSGEGADAREHLLVKAFEANLSNSLVVTTNRRSYHILLTSLPETYMASVQWRYPESGFVETFEGISAAGEKTDAGLSLDLQSLHFGYQLKRIKGEAPTWMPRQVFDDGRKTYIEFADNFFSQEAPVLFILNNKEKKLVNYRVKGRYYIVDRLFSVAQLRLGDQHPTVIEIRHG